MKLGPVTKIDKRNKTTSKNIDYDLVSANCDVIAIFAIVGVPAHVFVRIVSI